MKLIKGQRWCYQNRVIIEIISDSEEFDPKIVSKTFDVKRLMGFFFY